MTSVLYCAKIYFVNLFFPPRKTTGVACCVFTSQPLSSQPNLPWANKTADIWILSSSCLFNTGLVCKHSITHKNITSHLLRCHFYTINTLDNSNRVLQSMAGDKPIAMVTPTKWNSCCLIQIYLITWHLHVLVY